MLNRLLSLTQSAFVLDTETTSLDVQTARIVEIAFQQWDATGLVKEWASRINPGIPIPPEVTKIHGITDADVVGRPMFKQLAASLAKGFSDCSFFGQNVRYDLRVIQAEMNRCNQPWSYAGARVIDSSRLEALAVPRHLSDLHAKYTGDKKVQFFAVAKDGTRSEITDLYWFEENSIHTLDDLTISGERIEVVTASTGTPHDGAHGALSDVRAAATVIAAQIETYPDLPRDLDMLHAAQWPGWLTVDGSFKLIDGDGVCQFGKYRGVSMRSIPISYYDWLIGADFPADVKALANEAKLGKFPVQK